MNVSGSGNIWDDFSNVRSIAIVSTQDQITQAKADIRDSKPRFIFELLKEVRAINRPVKVQISQKEKLKKHIRRQKNVGTEINRKATTDKLKFMTVHHCASKR
jgi:hypothetical protein